MHNLIEELPLVEVKETFGIVSTVNQYIRDTLNRYDDSSNEELDDRFVEYMHHLPLRPGEEPDIATMRSLEGIVGGFMLRPVVLLNGVAIPARSAKFMDIENFKANVDHKILIYRITKLEPLPVREFVITPTNPLAALCESISVVRPPQWVVRYGDTHEPGSEFSW